MRGLLVELSAGYRVFRARLYRSGPSIRPLQELLPRRGFVTDEAQFVRYRLFLR
jgi:hypothetical protein